MNWHLSNNYNPKDGTYLVYFEGEFNIFTISENKWFDQMGFLIDGDDRYRIWWTELPEPPTQTF